MKNRLPWIDNIRTFAIFGVILCHSVESSYYWVRFGFVSPPSLKSWLFQTILFIIGRLGVPLFLMLSGTLLLSRKHEPSRFYKHSLIPLLITCEIWIVIYYFFNLWLSKASFMLPDFLDWIFLFKDTTFNHTWYLYTILGIYLAIPFLAVITRTFSIKQLAVPMLAVFAVNYILPIYNTFAGEINSSLHDVYTMLDLSFLGGTYGLYLILGYYIGNNTAFIEKIKCRYLAAVFALSFLACIGLEYYLYSNKYFHSDAVLWYDSPFIFICGAAAFELIKRLKINLKICKFIAQISFAIYLLHNIFLNICNTFIANEEWTQQYGIVPQTVLRFSFSFFGSLLIAGLFYLLPFKKLKKILLFIK